MQCYLWKSAWHPVNLDFAVLAGISRMLFAAYRRSTPDVFRRWVEGSDVIILESGMPPIFLEMIQKLNPNARKIYIASDLLDTIGVDPFVSEELNAHIDLFDTVVVPSRLMAPAFPRAGEDALCAARARGRRRRGGSLALCGRHQCGVGRLDAVRSRIFRYRCAAVPARHIPCDRRRARGRGFEHANVKIYGEMPYAQTLAYIKHAQFGVAPYRRNMRRTICATPR